MVCARCRPSRHSWRIDPALDRTCSKLKSCSVRSPVVMCFKDLRGSGQWTSVFGDLSFPKCSLVSFCLSSFIYQSAQEVDVRHQPVADSSACPRVLSELCVKASSGVYLSWRCFKAESPISRLAESILICLINGRENSSSTKGTIYITKF